MIDRISVLAAQADRVDAAPVAEILRLICQDWLHEFLKIYYGPLQTVKQLLRDNTPGLFNWLKNRRRYFVGRERAAIFSRLAADGAPEDYLTDFDSELKTVEDVVMGHEFAAFVRPYLAAFGASNLAVTTTPVALAGKAQRQWT